MGSWNVCASPAVGRHPPLPRARARKPSRMILTSPRLSAMVKLDITTTTRRSFHGTHLAQRLCLDLVEHLELLLSGARGMGRATLEIAVVTTVTPLLLVITWRTTNGQMLLPLSGRLARPRRLVGMWAQTMLVDTLTEYARCLMGA